MNVCHWISGNRSVFALGLTFAYNNTAKTSNLITIDDPRLNEDRERNVLLVHSLLEAAATDHTASSMTKGKFSRRNYERMLNDAYPDMDNRTAFQTAGRYYNVVVKGSKGTASTLSGQDVYRIVRFFLRNLAGYGWPTIKETLREKGAPYSELIALETGARIAPEKAYDALANQKVGDVVGPELDPGTKLRELADVFDGLQRELRLANTNQRMMTQEMVEIRKQVFALTTAFSRLLRASAAMETPNNFKQDLNDLNKKLERLQSFV